ncbi:hypothetical protein B0T17DRAFT_245053 [Bombardia bombarda]|uniref:Uncharacterized protein n=1 Tax=Bombardia bombarda TaxID=252184 RepID=A0AA39WZM8_9PEZI|nr:hypothetical protein B0T17DRAFT_245053 [Bombardia bombarda]
MLFGTADMAVGRVLQVAVSDIVVGFGNGIYASTAPVRQRETFKGSWRGKLVVTEFPLNISGFVLSMAYPLSSLLALHIRQRAEGS